MLIYIYIYSIYSYQINCSFNIVVGQREAIFNFVIFWQFGSSVVLVPTETLEMYEHQLSFLLLLLYLIHFSCQTQKFYLLHDKAKSLDFHPNINKQTSHLILDLLGQPTDVKQSYMHRFSELVFCQCQTKNPPKNTVQ